MARPSTEAVGLRLPHNLLDRVNAKAEEMGMNRSALICLALNTFLDGSPSAAASPPVASSISTVDQPARDAMVALESRVRAVEQELAEMRALQVAADKVLADASDSFVDRLKA